jgi:Na+/proline symporter
MAMAGFITRGFLLCTFSCFFLTLVFFIFYTGMPAFATGVLGTDETMAGIIAGFLIDLLWYAYLAAETGVYEIVPGFFGGTLITITVSCCTRKPDDEVMELFQKANLKTEEKISE